MRDREVRAACRARAGRFLWAFGIGVAFLAAPAAAQTRHWAIPDVGIPRPDRPDEPAVFDTVPVPVRAKPTSTRWSRIMRASLDQPALRRLAGPARGMMPHEQAAFVQAAVNRAVRNRGSAHNCSDDGYWAPAGETLGRGVGDCIDIAIAKMEALRLLGIPARDLYLTTGYAGSGATVRRGRESAALLVRTGDEFWLLTDGADRVIAARPDHGDPAFTPIITYGVGKTWVHGKLVRIAPRAGQPAEVASVSADASPPPSRSPR